MNTESKPASPTRYREDEIIADAAKEIGVAFFPNIADYSAFTPTQKYIAGLAEGIRSAEAQVAEQAAQVVSSATNALQSFNSLGVLHGSGPLLDVYSAILVERRAALRSALRMLLRPVVEVSGTAEMAWADSKFYGHS